MSPHGSYERCGSIIAAAFKAAGNSTPERIVLIGPVHREETDSVILPESDRFRTALGDLDVDQESVEALLSCGTKFIRNDIPHLEEHCIEVQLPFVRTLFPKSTIVPILLGKVTKANVKSLSHGLFVVFGTSLVKTLFVVSANFSGLRNAEDGTKEIDSVLSLAETGDWEKLVEAKVEKHFQSCGVGCIAACLAMPFPDRSFRIIEKKSTVPDPGSDRMVEYAAVTLA